MTDVNYDELVRELREDPSPRTHLAADAIEALSARVAEQQHFHRVNRDGYIAMSEKCSALEQERDRLKALNGDLKS